MFLKGSAFESVYQKLFPEYKDIIISHEAGHFLVAYLMGVSLRACVTSAWSAREFNEINGKKSEVNTMLLATNKNRINIYIYIYITNDGRVT